MKPFKNHRLLIALAIFLLIEMILFLHVDTPLALAMKRLDTTHPALINFFRVLTELGEGKWYEWPSGIGALFCLGIYHVPRIGAELQARILNLGQSLVYFFVCTGSAGILTNILKPLFGRARPKLLFLEDIYGFRPLTFDSNWNAMPSGHATTIVAVAVTLSVLFPRARIPLAVGAIIIAFSRVMVNAHYLSDVLAGTAIGWLVTAFLTLWFFKKGLLTAPAV